MSTALKRQGLLYQELVLTALWIREKMKVVVLALVGLSQQIGDFWREVNDQVENKGKI